MTGSDPAANCGVRHARRFPVIERRSIDWITPGERHGTVSAVSPLFFIANWNFFTVALGFSGPALGLSVGWSIAASTLGLLTGTFFTACHATQGSRLGLPQIIQSRAQFGFYGVIVIVAMALACYLAFGVVFTILTAHGLAEIFGWSPLITGLVVNLVGGAFAIAGHDHLHRLSRFTIYATVPLMLAFTVALFMGKAGGDAPSGGHGFAAKAFFTVFAVSAACNMALAPVVSDYTRYLPVATPSRWLIASVYAGAGISALWLMAVGAWLSASYHATDALAALHLAGDNVVRGFGAVLVLASAMTLVVGIATAAYSVSLQFLTGADLIRRFTPTRSLRIAVTVLTIVIYLLVALPFGNHVVDAASDALSILLFLLVPWTAINLVDYFFIRRGDYVIGDLFTPEGVYGGWSWRGLVAYLLGFLAMLPFAALPFCTGPLSALWGGIDVSWLAGLIAAAVAYLMLTRDRRTGAARLGADSASA
ncbi:allantoin permease [Mycobacterium saskatchewanense]|uniref:Allantoin permease n=1 Tax=Mycobacterium saskatchewanense TaxID=220927 RepID=A0AAJ3NK62_9MYCO|nr:cytosine permease [Mycobacterium saskatchewanense]ORW64087.1 allantoin permease [Mycobacterium saskatchewanense]